MGGPSCDLSTSHHRVSFSVSPSTPVVPVSLSHIGQSQKAAVAQRNKRKHASNNNNNNNNTTVAVAKKACLQKVPDVTPLLDIHSFHQGQEVVHDGYHPSQSSSSFHVTFPLNDDHDHDNAPRNFYKETIPNNHHNDYSTIFISIAREYGLSRNQYIQLIQQLQDQIHSSIPTQSQPTHLYGSLTAFVPEGMWKQNPTTQSSTTTTTSTTIATHTNPPPNTSHKHNNNTTTLPRKAPFSKKSSSQHKKSNTGLCTKTENSRTVPTPLYATEIQRRLLHECGSSIPCATTTSVVVVCHKCRRTCETEKDAIRFQCPEQHAVCSYHWHSTYQKQYQQQKRACPFCTLTCSCKVCLHVLASLCTLLQNKHNNNNNTPIQDIPMEGLYALGMSEMRMVMTETMAAIQQPFTLEPSTTTRRRPTIREFPIEVMDGIPTEPVPPKDYFRVFTRGGSTDAPYALRYHHHDAAADSPTSQEKDDQLEEEFANRATAVRPPGGDDGSVDYCNLCKKAGDILCCDFCPRAFHEGCLREQGVELDDEDPWKCPCCIKEERGEGIVTISGLNSLPGITISHAHHRKMFSTEDLRHLRVLSILHEILLDLLQFDFGNIFGTPVDVDNVEGYKETIKHPMDLGTIASNLLKGKYFPDSAPLLLEDVAVAVLKDIELVWHNCMTFNFEGSAFYLMAQVQRRRARGLIRKNVEPWLSRESKASLRAYIQNCNESRTKKPKKVATFEAKKKGAARARPVAIVDPDYCQIVKVYKAGSGAIQAMRILLDQGFDSGWADLVNNQETKFRRILSQSSYNPSILLFGYRWMDLGDLLNGDVYFPVSPPKSFSTISSAQEERKSHSRVRLATASLLKPSESSSSSWICRESTDGRKVFYSSLGVAQRMNPSLKEDWIRREDSLGEKKEHEAGTNDLYSWKRVVREGKGSPLSEYCYAGIEIGYFQVDSIRSGGDITVAYSSLDDAYEDWKKYSLAKKKDDSLEYFEEHVLNSYWNEDGVFWRRNFLGPTEAEKLNGVAI